MRFFTLILLISFGFLNGALAQDDQVNPVFDLADQPMLLGKLYDSKLFNSEGEVLWKPTNFSDELSAQYSSDGFIHTRLDTVMYYTTFGISRAVALFTTLEYDGEEVVDGSYGIAVFGAALEGGWEIERFVKTFAATAELGETNTFSLMQFGNHQWCLSMQIDWTGQGVFSEYADFYDLESLQKVFNYVIHEDNTGVLSEDQFKYYSFDKSIHFLTTEETKSGWWNFEIVARGTQPGENSDASIPANKVTRYAFDWDTNTYMRSCD